MAIVTTSYLNATIQGMAIKTIASSTGNYAKVGSRSVQYIVMHYTGNSSDTAQANGNYFKNNSNAQASAHFFVDNTSIVQSVPICDRAWHCGANTYYHSYCRNANSIGIEMCCSGNYKISDKTKENAAQLCAYLCKMLGIAANQVDTYVVRHWDVTHKECPAQMAGSYNAEWNNFKARVKTLLGNVSATQTAVTTTSTRANNGYKVKVTANLLNIRKGPGSSYGIAGTIADKGVYTIVGIKGNWGQLASGAGWICLDYTKVV